MLHKNLVLHEGVSKDMDEKMGEKPHLHVLSAADQVGKTFLKNLVIIIISGKNTKR